VLFEDLAGEFGGEYDFDGYNITWVDALGQDRGAVVKYGINLLDLEVENVLDGYESGIYPFWGEAGSTDRPLVEIADKILYYSTPGYYPMQIIRPVDMSEYFETQPTPTDLAIRARGYERTHTKLTPPRAFTIHRIKRQGDVPIDLGDTIRITHRKWSTNEQVRVVGLTLDALRGKVRDLEVGAGKATLLNLIQAAARLKTI
jgi:phage-related protein